MPTGIIDAIDNSILVGAGWQDICTKFHRVHPETLVRCQESDCYIKDRLKSGAPCQYKCRNGLWDIGIPIIVSGRHLATLFLGQFFHENEIPEKDYFVRQGHHFGFDIDDYLAALDQVPHFTHEKIDSILSYNQSLAGFLANLAESALSRKTAGEQISEQNQIMQGVLEHTHMMAAYLDRDFNFVWANRAYADTCKTTAALLKGKNHFELYPHKENQAIFQRVVDTGDPFFIEAKPFEFPDQPEKGITYWDWSLIPVKNESDTVIGLVFTLADVTRRATAEETLKKHNETLAHKVAEQTRMARDRAVKLQKLVGELTLAEQKERQRLAQILHDHLQQLLVGARINSEILCRNTDKTHEKFARNAFDLISKSLETSRSLTAELYPAALQQGLSAALKWTERWISDNHGISIDLHTDPVIDPTREEVTVFLYQSTRELLLNVVKHAGVSSARVEMSCDPEKKQLRVTVSDQGAGFDPDAALKNEGTGFGLFSIKERLELMGGCLGIESESGKGASLSLIVPLEIQEKEKEPLRETGTADTLIRTGEHKIRTLVVDDHTVVRQGISAMLSFHSDIELVGEAGNGREAREQARQLQPDVILMDINKPLTVT